MRASTSLPRAALFALALAACLGLLGGPAGARPGALGGVASAQTGDPHEIGEIDRAAISATYQRYAVAADHPLASQAGAEVLAAGGNAADAAAATMLALGVVSPASSGLGGGGFATYYRASDGSVAFLDFRERAPSSATPGMFNRRPGDDEQTAESRSRAGGLAVGVPGEPAGIEELLRRFGSGRVDRAAIAAPAIRYATEGFVAGDRIARYHGFVGASMREDPVMRRWTERGEGIPADRRLTNPEHARTLRDFAREGAAPFYRGRIARAIVTAVRRHGGGMSAEDLRAYTVAVREPLAAERFGYRWITPAPPSAGGYTMLESLALLERWLPPPLRQPGALYLHALAESFKGPYMDRQHYLGDPDFVRLPLAALSALPRREQRAAVYHPTLAHRSQEYEQRLPSTPPDARPGNEAGTSHLCVVDAEGNVASVTTTINLPFGARLTAAGIFLNDEMDDFAREVGEQNAFGLVGGAPNLPGPGHRPLSSMTPTIVLDERGPVMCVGGSGGSRIITAVEQVALNVLVLGIDPVDAVVRPRIHHQGMPDVLSHEEGIDEEVLARLGARGHELSALRWGAVTQMIRIVRTEEGVRLIAVSDPRKGGRPAGQ